MFDRILSTTLQKPKYSRLKTPDQHQWRRSGVFIVNFEYISHFFLVCLLKK